MIKRILVALSGTPFTASAVARSIEIARSHDAAITGVTLVDPARLADVGPVPIGGGAAAHSLAERRTAETRDRIEDAIAEFERACEHETVRYAVDRETGSAFDRLKELWRYHDITIIGLRGLFEYGVVQNPNDQIVRLIRHGVRPIIAVSREHKPISRVLIAYNGSSESAMAMKRFAHAQLWPDVTLKIACFGFDEDEATPLLTDAMAFLHAHGYEPEAESLPGYPEEGLLKHADHWNADLVVMGSTSRSKLMKLVWGPTALEVLTKAGVPLFLSQ